MNAEALISQLRTIYANSLRIDPTSHRLDGNELVRQLPITSILALEILVNMEIHFDIELDPATFDISALNSLDRLAKYLHPQLPEVKSL